MTSLKASTINVNYAEIARRLSNELKAACTTIAVVCGILLMAWLVIGIQTDAAPSAPYAIESGAR